AGTHTGGGGNREGLERRNADALAILDLVALLVAGDRWLLRDRLLHRGQQANLNEESSQAEVDARGDQQPRDDVPDDTVDRAINELSKFFHRGIVGLRHPFLE